MKQIYTMETVHSKCKPRFAHEYALAELKSKGYILGLASNSIRSTIDIMMKKSCLECYLDVTLSNEDVSNPKPDPEIYKKIINQLGVVPSETLIIEDNEHGIKAAKASGAHVLEVRDVEEVNINNILWKIRKVESEATQ